MKIAVPLVGSNSMAPLNDIDLGRYQNRAESDIFIYNISSGELRGLP